MQLLFSIKLYIMYTDQYYCIIGIIHVIQILYGCYIFLISYFLFLLVYVCMYTNILYICIINMKLRHGKKTGIKKKCVTKNSIYTWYGIIWTQYMVSLTLIYGLLLLCYYYVKYMRHISKPALQLHS